MYRPNITALEKSVIGHTKVYLDGHKNCRTKECNLGNLIADSMVYSRVMEHQGGLFWTDAAIAFIMGGGIRSSIEKRSDGSITETDVLTVLPFENDIYVIKITGRTLLNALEHSAKIRNSDSNGGFLQMAGVRVIYDFNRKEFDRVVSVEVRCAECEVPSYEVLNLNKLYNVILPEFLLNGGDAHNFNEGNTTTHLRLKKNDQSILKQYLGAREFVYPEVEGRITILEKSNENSAASISSPIVAIFAILLLKLFP